MDMRPIISAVWIVLFMALPGRTPGAVPNIKNLGIEDGLSNNFVVSVTRDGAGNVWIATENGLNRFNGKNFSRFLKNGDNPSVPAVSANELNKVYADTHEPYIWIATQRAGLNRYDTRTGVFHTFTHDPANPDGIITNDITDVVNSADGHLWIATYHRGVEYYDKAADRFVHYNTETVEGLPSDHVWCVCEDPAGFLYIGHVDRGLSVLAPGSSTAVNFINDPDDDRSLPGNTVRAVYRDDNGNVWIGTDRGLALFDRTAGKFTVFRHDPGNEKSLGADYIFDIKKLSDNRLWIGTENGGVSIMDLGQTLFRHPEEVVFTRIGYSGEGARLSDKTVRSIYEDPFGNVWLGTYGGGVDVISHLPRFFDSWHYFDLPPGFGRPLGLTNKIAWGITVGTDNRVWVGTDGGGINVFREGRRTAVMDCRSGLPDDAVLCATRSGDGNLWFGTYSGGVALWDDRAAKFVIPFDLPTGQVRALMEDGAGNIWAGTNAGLFRWSRESGEVQGFVDRLPERDVRAVYEDRDGNIWVGTFGQGLAVFDRSMEPIAFFNTVAGLPSNTVNNISGDRAGNIWIATGEGLVLQKRGSAIGDFTVYGIRDGLANSHIRAVTEDSGGNIWFSTNNGIGRFVAGEGRFYNYNRFDGVPVGEFMSGSAAVAPDGKLYFGSQNGVCFFDPQDVPLNIALPPTVISFIRVYDRRGDLSDGGREQPVDGPVTLGHWENTFEVVFTVPDFALGDMVEYEYRMGGIDDKWYSAGSGNTVTFRSLQPGKYVFDVRTRLNNQPWDDDLSSVQIIVTPPLWKTWWMKTLYIISAAAVMVIANLLYRRKLSLENSLALEKADHIREQEMNDERLRFFTNVTHELRTPLTLILGPLEDIKGDPALPEAHRHKIDTIYKSSNKLLVLINQILEFRKTETSNKRLSVVQGNLADLITETCLKYQELNMHEGVEIGTVVESESNELFFDPEVVSCILDNLISNALKYTDKGSVTIYLRDVRIDNEVYTEIEVADTGKGIGREELDRIFERYYQVEANSQHSGTGIGLSLVQNLVTLHKGTIKVDSEPDVGTSFRVRLPKYHTYPEARAASRGEFTESREWEPAADPDNGRNIVLVVEDNEQIRDYIAESLSEFYIVRTAADGNEGEIVAFEQIPDLIITDIMMPRIDGIELCRRLKNDVRTSHIPVVMLTARDTIHDKTEGYESGADSYITKPFSSKLLRTRIENLFEARRRTADTVNRNTVLTDQVGGRADLGPIDNEFIEKVTALVEANLASEKTDVNFLADKMCMSHSTLYRKIKALTGITTNEFIRKIRMRNAGRLLRSGSYNVSEVSFMVGINSMTYFRHCFREEFGVSPSEFIRSQKPPVSGQENEG